MEQRSHLYVLRLPVVQARIPVDYTSRVALARHFHDHNVSDTSVCSYSAIHYGYDSKE